jgi:hypothetical protein
MNLHDQISFIVADIEWSDAARSEGQPISVAFVRLVKGEHGWENQEQRYGIKEVDPIETTSWTRERVLPRLDEHHPESFDLVMNALQKQRCLMVCNDDATARLLHPLITINVHACLLFEIERARYWGVFKTWSEQHDGYHALEDSLGVANSIMAVLNDECSRKKHGTISL